MYAHLAMAPEIHYVSPKPVQGFVRINEEIRRLTEAKTTSFPFREGISLTQSDLEPMGIPVDQTANSGFWIPADQERRAALKSALDSFLKEDSSCVKSILNESKIFKDQLAEHCSPTIGDAYSASTVYIGNLLRLVDEGIYHNEALQDVSGDPLFEDIEYVHVSACPALRVSKLI